MYLLQMIDDDRVVVCGIFDTEQIAMESAKNILDDRRYYLDERIYRIEQFKVTRLSINVPTWISEETIYKNLP